MHQFIFVIEPDDEGVPRYVAFNKCARDFVGLSERDVIGKSATDLFPGRMGDIAYEKHIGAFRTASQSTFEILLPIGLKRRFLRTTLTPEMDVDGVVRRVFGTSVDISGEEPLGAASGNPEQNETEDFIKLAAHDLRSPVRNVKVISEMLREDFVDMGDGKVQLLDMLEKLSEKAMILLDDIVSLAQTSVPGQRTEIDFEFHELVQDLLDVLDPLGTSDVSADQALIHGDRNVMQMVLRNLIDNALKHAEEQDDGFRLSLAIAVEPNGLDQVEVTVVDDGGGFRDTAILFLNGGKLQTGSGFGLLGVRRLVQARGGTLGASNLSGGRAQVHFSMPGMLLSGGRARERRHTVRSRLRA